MRNELPSREPTFKRGALPRRLILASNRGPVTYDLLPDGSLHPQRGSGGLVAALEAIHGQWPLTWVACAMTEGDRRAAARAPEAHGNADETARRRFVVLPKSVYRRYYDVFANRVLWFLQHYLWNAPYEPRFDAASWSAWEHGYVRANAAFADAIVEELQADEAQPVVMLQDYHLYLAAEGIRARVPRAILQHFTHIPWPEPRYWQLLPRAMRGSILRGLLANDILGFQTTRDAANFLATVDDTLDHPTVHVTSNAIHYQGREVQVRTYPISVDPDRLRAQASEPAARHWLAALAPGPDQKTIVRADRLDPSKNILRGFEAFELLLRQRPDWHGQLRFLAFLVPSREQVPAYRRYRRAVMAKVAAINARHGTPDWTPIQVFDENLDGQALAGLMLYDVLLVNPILDGMNLVAKEGPVVNQRDGVLVLSEGAGAHQQLKGWVRSVAAADVRGTAEALERALMMRRPEREAHATGLRVAIEREGVHGWLGAQLKDLEAVAHERAHERTRIPGLELPASRPVEQPAAARR